MPDRKFLEGCKVVDISQLIAGSGAAGVLADMGADVVKIESRSGDVLRNFSCERGGYFAQYATYNRGKRSLCLDLKTKEGVDIVRRLAERADILVQNYRPGALDRLGLGEKELRGRNRRLIYASISGVGATGPYSDQPVMDMVVQALSGICFSQTNGGAPQMLRVPIADKITAATTVQWILAALFQREKTGNGAHVEVAMLDAAVSFAWAEIFNRDAYVGGGVNGTPGLSPYWVAETRDGYIVWACSKDEHVDALLEIMGKTALHADPRLASMAVIRENLEHFSRSVSDGFRTRTSDEWLGILRKIGILCSPVLKPQDALDDPQLVHNGLVRTAEHQTAGTCRVCLPSGRVNGERYDVDLCASELGQHTDEVLRELNYSAQDISRLKASGVAYQYGG